MTLTPSHIIEYMYCPRYTWYEYVLRLPQQEDKYHKVLRGRELHRQKAEREVGYLRRRLGVVDKALYVYLANEWLRGEVDEVLWLADGTMAPLDYKFAKYEDEVYVTYRTQLACYAVLIEAHYGRPVERGYLVYTRSKHKVVEVPLGAEEKAAVRAHAEAIFRIIGQNRFPRATRYKKKCLTCTYRNVCPQ